MVDLKDFSGLVDIYYTKVFYHCLKTIKNNHDSADITQNTFTKAFINIKNLKNHDSFGAWIFTICNNEIKMFYRNRQKIISDSSLDTVNIPDKTSTAKKYHGLYSAIEILEEKYRNLIILKYFAGFNAKEIAILTKISEKLVKSRLYDARKKLESLLLKSENSSSFTNIFSYNQERKKDIMSTVKLLELGSQVIPCMSAYGQKELLKCAENNEKFSSEVLAEFSKIEKADEFTVECDGKLSYDEFVKILTCCSDDVIHRIDDTWLKGKINKLLRDTDNYRSTGGYIKSVEYIMTVPSIVDTVNWYRKYLGWRCWRNDEQVNNEDGHSFICAYDSYDVSSRSFGGFHLWKTCEINEVTKNANCFVFVTGLEALRKKIESTGWDKISDICKTWWGVKQFTVEDLNGFKLHFSEWDCE